MKTAQEGAGRFDHLHGDEDGIEVTDAHRKEAKENILDTIESFGQYPQPPYKGGMPRYQIKFLLSEFIEEEMEPRRVADDLAWLITTYGLDRMEAIDKVRDRIMEQVAALPFIDALADEVAAEIAQQEREDA